MASLAGRLDRLEKMLEAQAGSGGNPYRSLPTAHLLALVVLWAQGFGYAAPVPRPHPGEPTELEQAAALEQAHALLRDEGYDARIALLRQFSAAGEMGV